MGVDTGGFERRIRPMQAVAINMTQMCGVGPFITIPLIVVAMGGPQAMFGWVVGALLALVDGLVWAELGAAMPGAGGTYNYLREAFQYRTGKLMPFLFVWTAILFIPLIMSTGVIGLVDYLGYLWPAVVDASGGPSVLGHVVGVVVVGAVVLLLYRKIGDISRITTVFFAVMLVSILVVVVAAYTHFHAGLAFSYPAGAFALHGPFWTGLGAGLVLAIYDYLGYNTVAYLGAEVREPGRTLPRAIIISIVGIMVLYLLLQVGVLGALPWQEVARSSSVASLVLEHTWGVSAARVVTVLIIVTAFASVFAGLLGGSRVPFEAARDRLFLPVFARLHPRLRFPHVGLLVLGVITAVGSLFNLSTVITMLTAVFVLVQSVAQVFALVVLRRRQPGLARPYRQWLYPVPSVLALVGWAYVYYSADSGQEGLPWLLRPIQLSLLWLVAGIVAFVVWARVERTWPFGPKDVEERFAGRDVVEASAASDPVV